MKLEYCEKVVAIGDIIEINNYSYISPLRVHILEEQASFFALATWFEEVQE